MPIERETNESNAEIELKPVILKAKIENIKGNLNAYLFFYFFYLLNHYILFLLLDNFFFHLFF